MKSYSCALTGADVDIGASWIHGASANNPVVKLKDKFEIDVISTDDDNERIYSENGTEYNTSQIDDQWENLKKGMDKIDHFNNHM